MSNDSQRLSKGIHGRYSQMKTDWRGLEPLQRLQHLLITLPHRPYSRDNLTDDWFQMYQLSHQIRRSLLSHLLSQVRRQLLLQPFREVQVSRPLSQRVSTNPFYTTPGRNVWKSVDLSAAALAPLYKAFTSAESPMPEASMATRLNATVESRNQPQYLTRSTKAIVPTFHIDVFRSPPSMRISTARVPKPLVHDARSRC